MPSLRLPSRPSARRLAWWARVSRRLLAACCLAAAVALTLKLAFPPPPPVGVLVTCATKTLPVGHVLQPDDLRVCRWAGPDAPASPSPRSAVAGRTLSVPVEAGDLVTPRLVLGPTSLAGLGPDFSAVPVAGLDPLTAQAVRAGDHVLLTRGGVLVADAAPVLLVGEAPGDGLAGPSAGGRSLLVALTSTELSRWHRTALAGPDPAPAEVALIGR